jgi:lycopene beta-cyclase
MGYGGGWFHPTTGYSFPMAARFAGVVAREKPEHLRLALRSLARSHGRQLRFATLLNRLLFGAFVPEDRRNVLERFYQLPEASIRRFYALTTSAGDRARIVCGRPPRGFSLRVALTRGAHT